MQDRCESSRVAGVEELDFARGVGYRFLALACTDPRAARWPRVQDPVFLEIACAAAELLARHPAGRARELAPGEAPGSSLRLRPLAAMLTDDRESFVALHDRVFGLVVSKECPPYETEYCPQTFSVYRSEQMADIAGFYHAFGVMPGRDAPERPDHVALELEFMAWLVEKERLARSGGDEEGLANAEICRDAQARFLRDHLAWWIPAFAHALAGKAEGWTRPGAADRAPRSFHGRVAGALAAFIGTERALLGVPAPTVLLAPRAAAETGAACDSCALG